VKGGRRPTALTEAQFEFTSNSIKCRMSSDNVTIEFGVNLILSQIYCVFSLLMNFEVHDFPNYNSDLVFFCTASEIAFLL
jgi:hypothetical protein